MLSLYLMQRYGVVDRLNQSSFRGDHHYRVPDMGVRGGSKVVAVTHGLIQRDTFSSFQTILNCSSN